MQRSGKIHANEFLVLVCGIGIPIFCALAFSPPVHAASSLVRYWTFDETAASAAAADSSGNAASAASSGTTTPSTDVPGAITFTDPRSTYLDGAHYFTIDRPVQDDFSICTWLKTSSVGNGPYHWQTAALFDSEVGSLGDDIGFGLNDSGQLTYGNGGAYDTTLNGTTVVADNAWHHVCVTRNQASGEAILYVDGTAEESGVTDTARLNGNAEALIGNGTDGGTVIVGNLDDYRIYDAVLTPSQVAALASGAEGLGYPALENAEIPRPKVKSWEASAFYSNSGSCRERVRLVVKGSGFKTGAKVRIGGTAMASVTRDSGKRLTATVCLSKIQRVKTSPHRGVSVKNPGSEWRKAGKRLDIRTLSADTR